MDLRLSSDVVSLLTGYDVTIQQIGEVIYYDFQVDNNEYRLAFTSIKLINDFDLAKLAVIMKNTTTCHLEGPLPCVSNYNVGDGIIVKYYVLPYQFRDWCHFICITLIDDLDFVEQWSYNIHKSRSLYRSELLSDINIDCEL